MFLRHADRRPAERAQLSHSNVHAEPWPIGSTSSVVVIACTFREYSRVDCAKRRSLEAGLAREAHAALRDERRVSRRQSVHDVTKARGSTTRRESTIQR